MIISRTPFRISFFGGGTDYPSWYLKHGGAVLATTIDKYCHLTLRHLPPFFEHKMRLVYSRVETCQAVEDIHHPSIRAVLQFLNFDRGMELHHDGDLPARSGMGSSSSFTVGLLHAMNALLGRMPSKHELATQAIMIEQVVLKETVGSQDQVMAAYGGLNNVVFEPSGEISIRPVTLHRERIAELSDHLMLFYTGIKRTAANVADSYVAKIEDKRRQLRVMHDLVNEAISILSCGDDINGFGELLQESWQLKRSLSPVVSNDLVDEMYQAARDAGALGGKLTGAGGGGFMLLFVPPRRQEMVRQVLNKVVQVPFKFEFNGSQIIFYDMEEDYSREEKLRDEQGARNYVELNPQEVQEGWV